MKIHKKIGISLFSTIALVGCIFTSCDNDINIGKEDEGRFMPNEKTSVYVINELGKQSTGLTEIHSQGETKLRLKLNHVASNAISAKFVYNKDELSVYNAANNTDYEIFPQTLTEIKNEGLANIDKGKIESGEVEITMKSDVSLDPRKSYVIPLSIQLESGANSVTNGKLSYLVFVKDLTTVANTDKFAKGADGKLRKVEIISCMEMGNTNPLNNLSFTMKSSGKPLVDILIMFSGNVTYNATDGKVQLTMNNPIQYTLDNYSEILKPLKDRGIKIVMGIMPHHDRVSLTNMSDETAKKFIQELKFFIDAYDLDGVFWDEEYAEMIYPAPPGFVNSSNQALSKMIYEFNRVMPDKLSMAYTFGATSYLSIVNGKKGGEYITHGLHDYENGYDLSTNYPGLPKSGWGMYSQEYEQERGITSANSTELKEIRDNGYCHMIFAMDPFRKSYQKTGFQLRSMQAIAKGIFDDELVVGKFYEKNY